MEFLPLTPYIAKVSIVQPSSQKGIHWAGLILVRRRFDGICEGRPTCQTAEE